ncbi:hypothetical protein [Siphonobacter curvatus]|uniref:Uncharacterized protein n=1 Tax=Siphonobacter curvatus TaxID=2094562 RepID=A0A2S7IGY3_9BACT|nr:hypothetical protein [Siphonobacter curvatus]PQA54928.1 hypothetical protein C5O19_20475 [Siphonobacter curvatus]
MKPSENQIQRTITLLDKKLLSLQARNTEETPLQEGLQEALSILLDGRTSYASIPSMKSRQGRAIALLTIDYMNGVCEQSTLLKAT